MKITINQDFKQTDNIGVLSLKVKEFMYIFPNMKIQTNIPNQSQFFEIL